MDLKIPDVPIAFFDLDDTLVHKNTNTLWLEWRLKRDPRALLELARIAAQRGWKMMRFELDR